MTDNNRLTGEDRRELLLALWIAIAHEERVVERLQADQDLRCLKASIEDRREQIAKFEKLLAKLQAARISHVRHKGNRGEQALRTPTSSLRGDRSCFVLGLRNLGRLPSFTLTSL
jgi:hypothetical protein